LRVAFFLVAFLRVAFLRVAFFLVAFFLAMIIDLLVSTMRAFGPLTDVPSIEFYTIGRNLEDALQKKI
jgi:hypothetical protein